MNQDEMWQRADEELFAMLASRPIGNKQPVGFFVPVKYARRLQRLERLLANKKQYQRIAGYAAEAAVFLTATVCGWMQVNFGLIVSAICGIRAAAIYWKIRHPHE